jgi:hypothetical protein
VDSERYSTKRKEGVKEMREIPRDRNRSILADMLAEQEERLNELNAKLNGATHTHWIMWVLLGASLALGAVNFSLWWGA